MKVILFSVSLIFLVNAQASIDSSSDDGKGKATPAEITSSQACFRQLEDESCGSPEEKKFRSCMQNVYPKLTRDCQNLMTELYGVK
jgi:hypothetical protein